MKDDAKVYVVQPKRGCLVMRFRDPLTRKIIEKSTGTKSRKEAERIARNWRTELLEGRFKAPSKITWDEFRRRYEQEHLASLADKTQMKASTVLSAVKQWLNVTRLSDLTAERISHLQKCLRDQVRSESTIKGYLATLKAALRWAKDMGMLLDVPKIQMPKRAKSTGVIKARTVTFEVFELILEAVPIIVGDLAAESWRRLLRGLWLSGLRLGEAVDLWWDRDDRLRVVGSGDDLMLLIHAELEKGKRDRLLPIAPEFADFLRETPVSDWTGRVFQPLSRSGCDRQLTSHHVGVVIARIGEAANIRVQQSPTSGKVKFATAQDLRRAFGTRWAELVPPAVLQQIMRHESIETTLRYYVHLDANRTSDILRDAAARACGTFRVGHGTGKSSRSITRKAENPTQHEVTPGQL